jgi:hypothetical protein
MIIVCNPVNVPSSLVDGLSHSYMLDVISITFTTDHCGWVHTQTQYVCGGVVAPIYLSVSRGPGV